MSSADLISWRILRADTSVSSPMTLDRSTISSTAVPQEGCHSAIVRSASQVAKDSFSQTSSHHASVT